MSPTRFRFTIRRLMILVVTSAVAAWVWVRLIPAMGAQAASLLDYIGAGVILWFSMIMVCVGIAVLVSRFL